VVGLTAFRGADARWSVTDGRQEDRRGDADRGEGRPRQGLRDLAALFLDDAVVNPPNEPAVKGRAAIRAWLEKFPPITEFKLNNEKVEGRKDLAYVLGTYTMTIVPPGAPGPVKDSGKFVTVLRRQPDGGWLAAVDMFSSDLPGPPPTK
jgi:ketosteroid isomerase-like protein